MVAKAAIHFVFNGFWRGRFTPDVIRKDCDPGPERRQLLVAFRLRSMR